MKGKIIGIFIIIASLAQAQERDIKKVVEHHPNGKIKLEGYALDGVFVDTLKSYNDKGKLVTTFIYGDSKLPRIVRTKQNNKSGAAKNIYGTYWQISRNNMVKDGVWLYCRKNGSVMDSVIFKNDSVIYRARKNKLGEILFENK